jgi:DNA-binding MarR family transcriptional regulator
MGGVAPGGVPLARLFVMGARQLVERLHERLAERGWADVRPAYGYVLGGVREGAMTVSDIAALLGVTKQAASKVVSLMERAGYVEYRADASDARAKLVAITPHGVAFLADAEAIYADLEAEWAAVLGEPAIEAMRETLTTVLRATNDGALPPVRPL